MKTTLLFLLLGMATYQLKAQSLLKINPADTLPHLLVDNNFKVKLNKGLALSQPNFTFGEVLSFNEANALKLNKQDPMPVAVLDGNSKMPVVKIGGYYTMPVKRTGTEYPSGVNLKTPTVIPAFVAPGK